MTAYGIADPGERQQIIAHEAVDLAARAMNTGRNPAEIVHELARLRGFAAAPAAAAQPAAAQPTAAQRVATIARGQQQAQTVGNMRGAAAPGLTAERLLEMSDAEFAKAIETAEGQGLMGT